MTNKIIHYKGLNGIRAIASLIVLCAHINQFAHFFGLSSLTIFGSGSASLAVVLFFVLSGYLITRLLLVEKDTFSKIDLPKFYIRRILRIWPIYYLIIIVGLLFYFSMPSLTKLNEIEIFKTFALYTFLISNIGFGMSLTFLIITPLWSVGVEEQFYVFWPILIEKSKNILKTLLLFIFAYLAIKISCKFLASKTIYTIVHFSCFDCMAIGGIGAYLIHIKSKYLALLFHPISQIISWSILAIDVFYSPVHVFSFLDNEIHAVFYLIIILNVSANPKTLIALENKIFDFIGRISYGIYVYHSAVIVGLSLIFKHVLYLKLENNFTGYGILFTTLIGSTLVISYLSYTYFESYFIKRKHTFTKIESSSRV